MIASKGGIPPCDEPRRLRGTPSLSLTAIATAVRSARTTSVGGGSSLVYLLRNTVTNLTMQDEQVACFRNAAEQLAPEGFS